MSAPEYAVIRVQRFRTPAGQPTCSTGPDRASTCAWLRSAVLGSGWLCRYAPDLTYLDRYGAEGLGHLIPAEGCPVWDDQ